MSVFAISGLISGTTTLILAVIVAIFGSVRNALHRALILLNISVSIWGFGCMMVGMSPNASDALFWWKIAHIGGLYVPVFLLQHNMLLLNEIKKRGFLIFGYMQATTFQFFSVFNLLQIKMSKAANIYYISPDGMTYPIFFATWSLVGIYATIILFNGYKHAYGERKTQLKYLCIALIIGFWGGASHFISVFWSNVFPFSNFLIPIFPLVTTYAILRHKALDIEVIIKKTLIFAGLFTSVFIIVGIGTFVLQNLLGKFIPISNWVSLGINIAILILLYDPINSFLVNVTNKYLFQKKYDPVALITSFSKTVLTELDLNKLSKSTVEKLVEALKLTSCAILIPNREGNKFIIRESYGIIDKKMSYEKDAHMMSYLSKVNSTILKTGEKPLAEPIRKDMDAINASACFAIMMRKQLIGVLCLGKKKSDENYTNVDTDTLLLLADALGVAITNALAFEDVRQKEKLAAIGMLAAGIKHDIGTPINKMSSAVQSFLIAKDEGDHQKMFPAEVLSEAYNLLKRCEITFDTISTISSKFADFARSKRQAELEIINVAESIEDALGVLSCELQARNIAVNKNIQETLPFIKADKDYMQQVLFNVIKNAAQAIEGAHRRKEESAITITVKEDPENNVSIRISDTGVGIPDDALDRIFEPYYTTKQERGGTGLGLAIVKELVERNAGRISVKSELGKGSTFILEFPKAKI
jgi:signal transduction histidine kinase